MDDLEAVRQITEILSKIKDDDVKERVIRWSLEKSGLEISAPASEPTREHGDGGASTPLTARQKGSLDIKSFINEKNPTSDNQFAAAVAYYYAFEAPEAEKKNAVGPSDLNDACRMVGRRRLGDPAKTLANATSMGYLDKVERGIFKINTVGENLVAITLPGDGRDSAVVRRPPAKKKKPAKSAKKAARKAGSNRKR